VGGCRRSSWPELADAAHQIDELLRTGAPRTLLHGDAKSPNFLFGRGGDGEGAVECAAYDFQYTGAGEPMKDVAYLLCSSVQVGWQGGDCVVRDMS
jgi:aminoglycoside phosphotransferase (APT) family kinase protein